MNGDDLGLNKIFGAILATALLIVGLKQGAEMFYAPHKVDKPGYVIAVQDTGGDAGAPVADTPPDWGTVLPAADVTAGQAVSTKCASCHTFTNGGANGTGPNNWGVVGRKPGSHPGFAYSAAMTDFGSKTPAWDYDHLYMFLANPGAYIAGTKMSFVGLKKPEDRINLIAWLRQQSSSPAPIPAPDPKKAAPAAAAPAAGAPAADANATAPAAAAGSGPVTTPTSDKTAPGAPPK
jgi:cytochrome c